MGRAIVGVSVALVVFVVGLMATYVAFRTVELDAALSAPRRPNSGPYWHVRTRALHYSFGGLGGNLHVPRAYVAMDLPDARHSFPISKPASDATKVLTAYVLPSGNLKCRGIVVPLAIGLDREGVVARVRHGFGETPLRRLVEEGSLSEIRLAFARDAYWAYAGAVLSVLAEYDVHSIRILLTVEYPPIGERRGLRCEFRPRRDPDPGARGHLDIHLAGAVPLDGESLVRIGERRWDFPDNPWNLGYSNASSEDALRALKTANAIWAEIDEHIGPLARRHDEVRIYTAGIDRRLAVRYVITLVDMLIGHGKRRIQFPDAGVALEFEVPPPGLDHLVPRKPVGMPLVRGPLIFFTLVGIGSAVYISLIGTRPSVRESRSRRRKPRVAS